METIDFHNKDSQEDIKEFINDIDKKVSGCIAWICAITLVFGAILIIVGITANLC